MTTVVNAFSPSMLPSSKEGAVVSAHFHHLSQDEARAFLADREFQSAVGHADTAGLFSQLLGKPVAENRVNVSLSAEGPLLLGSYAGPRLPPGATELPEGAKITWYVVTLD